MTTATDQYQFGAAPVKQEGGVYYRYPPAKGSPAWVKMVLHTAVRIGADKDEPEGMRYIQLSETLVNEMIEALGG
jgi:hypothetical protein